MHKSTIASHPKTPPAIRARRAPQALAADDGEQAAAERVALEHLLAMADNYCADGQMHQAMELYWELLAEHPEASQARFARKALLGVATDYERTGKWHAARSIYERLL